ncbi:MAG: hypothetical protein IJX19_05920 [Clostridia bacterium]|nr:hypothetical protein [Clostridia bacterium]
MQQIMQHPTYGEIVYTESFWTGKKRLTVNGVEAQAVSKKEFLVNGEKAVIKGNLFYAGISLCLGDTEIVLVAKSKWYEVVLALIPIVFLMTWGNSVTLCAIFPVVGGAIGGFLGGVAGCTSLMMMKKVNSGLLKILIGLGIAVLTILIAFVLALLLILILV